MCAPMVSLNDAVDDDDDDDVAAGFVVGARKRYHLCWQRLRMSLWWLLGRCFGLFGRQLLGCCRESISCQGWRGRSKCCWLLADCESGLWTRLHMRVCGCLDSKNATVTQCEAIDLLGLGHDSKLGQWSYWAAGHSSASDWCLGWA